MKTQFLSTLLASALVVSYIPAASAALDLTHSYVNATSPDHGNGVIDLLPVPGSFSYAHTFNSATTKIPGSINTNNPLGSGFYDDFVFQITSASANSITSTIDFSGILQISNLQVRLYNAAGNSFPVLGAPFTAPIDAWSNPVNYGPTTGTVSVLPTTQLSAGTYVLEVRGDVVGASGGSYSGVLNIAPVPVPAAAWLFGSSLLSLVSLRRKV